MISEKQVQRNNYKPVIIIKDEGRKEKEMPKQPDWVALILLLLGVFALYQGNKLGMFFILLSIIKYLWTVGNE